jgi:hypothetical protein
MTYAAIAEDEKYTLKDKLNLKEIILKVLMDSFGSEKALINMTINFCIP